MSGICKIKQQYIVADQHKEINLDCVSQSDKHKFYSQGSNTDESEAKKQKLSKKRKLRGQNKSRRPTFRVDRESELCSSLINLGMDDAIPECQRKSCVFLHDIDEYLKNKPKDLGGSCYNYQTFGRCSRGLTCRFATEHITENGRNKINLELYQKQQELGPATVNHLKPEVQTALRKRTYNFTLAETVLKSNTQKPSGSVTDEDTIKLHQREKKTIDFRDKLILSPLTTVGNLPFRRICKEFGADVTCGEMAMCSSLLQGAPQEWALLKRHKSENLFGVQLCANNPGLLARCGQLLEDQIEVDFVDVNLGCPIELVYKQGGGCGLLRRPKVLEACLRSLSQVVSVPVTVKLRTGVYSNENVAHKLIPKFHEWGVSLATVHGRSREQRYTKQSDWQYIRQCAQEGNPLPIVGNGDILSYEDYKAATETCPEMASIMIGRGGLIKPWIFTEIKEQKLWDISSSERFEIIKKYVNYGLEHWGSDTKGVENTRRFLLEWLSFLHRYVPVGLLEMPPQKINERPPTYQGRDDLETLMASTSAADWIKISEMLLGPVPENFKFLPKHKANSYK